MPKRRETLRRCRQRVRLHELLLQTPTIAPPDRGQLRSVCAAGRMHTKLRGRSDAQQHKPLRILNLFFSPAAIPAEIFLQTMHTSCSENFRLSQIEHTKFFRLPARLTEQIPFTQYPFCQFPAAIVQNRYNLPNTRFARRRTTGKTERGTMFSRIGSKQPLRSSGEPEPLKSLSQNRHTKPATICAADEKEKSGRASQARPDQRTEHRHAENMTRHLFRIILP